MARKTDRLIITKRSAGRVPVYAFEGELDHFTIAYAESFFSKEEIGKADKMVFDLRELDYLSSACSRAFLPVLKLMRRRGGDLKFSGVGGKCREVFELLGLGKFVEYRFEDPGEAVQAFDRPLPSAWVEMFKEGYIAKRKGRVFHFPFCRYITKPEKRDAVFFSTLNEAVTSGKKPCKVCKP
ncbi:MAG: STAS domain-containing protein [Planctomycetota bacterium]